MDIDTYNNVFYHIKYNKTFIINGHICTIYDYSMSKNHFTKRKYHLSGTDELNKKHEELFTYNQLVLAYNLLIHKDYDTNQELMN